MRTTDCYQAPRFSWCRFPADSRSTPADARSFVRAQLEHWYVPQTAIDDAELIVSELATNAVCHHVPAPGPVRVDVAYAGPTLTLAVINPGPRPQVLGVQRPGSTDTSGRGLAIVAALADAWGCRSVPSASPFPVGGTEVWAEIRIPARAALRPATERCGAS
jgi:anti-sigma regulatory factor (Ser/Thr protein kinase)